ncbi:MAG TPA: ShlB/FhaC/HecB family hemolysin secretion/activation protein [Sphingomonas sp.]
MKLIAAAAVAIAPLHLHAAQVRLDRADPTITEQTLPQLAPENRNAPQDSQVEAPVATVGSAQQATGIVAAVSVTGAQGIDPSSYADVIASVVGRELTRSDLRNLAGAVASVVRAQGYPFATASIEPQSMSNGVLRVSVDQGRIDAVRVIGARNATADALLVQMLAARMPVRQATLERALLLVGDIPGVRVKDTRYLRQDGFGILLVTIERDRASAYVQVDNRGSDEVGPVRSTALASLRGLASDGDELGLIVANTPVQPDEFAFARLRYSAPIDAAGSVLSASTSFGRSNPGALLAALNVVGRSTDVAVAYSRPLLRRREHSVWSSFEFRAVSIEQMLAGRLLRNDRLATLTGSLNGFASVAGGAVRGDISVAAGLPLSGVTRQGDPRTSRADGDGRFVTVGYQLEWTKKVARPLTLVLSSVGQAASRPLLATAEIGLGGPGYGRGYDYAERTGDKGIMGSAELRLDTGRVLRGVVDRTQLYGFVDGGTVGNLRAGRGGGTLASTGFGLRAGTGRWDGMVELALPLNADRFDTRDRSPRPSLRLSRSF